MHTVNLQCVYLLQTLLPHLSDVVVKIHNSSLCRAAVVLQEEMQRNTVYDQNAVCVRETESRKKLAEKAAVEYLCSDTCF